MTTRTLRFIFDLKAQLVATITSVCPTCKTRYFPLLSFQILQSTILKFLSSDGTLWVGKLLMLYALIWEKANGGNGKRTNMS